MAKRDGLTAATILALTTCALPLGAAAQTASGYQKPPAAIEELLDSPKIPIASISPDRKTLLVEQPSGFPTIADVAQPRYRLAGLRFSPKTSNPAVENLATSYSLQPIGGGAAKAISGLPANPKFTNAIWSPDSKHVAFAQRADIGATAATAGLQLWVIDVATAHAHRIGIIGAAPVKLNSILGRPCAWLPDSTELLCKIVPPGRAPAPKESDVPTGPDISENLGKATPAPTYEDMIKTVSEENIFEYYSTAQLAIVPLVGTAHTLPVKGLIDSLIPSPDGKYALVSALHRPFSYTVPAERFPKKTEIVTLKSGAVKDLNDRPLIDNLPISRDAVEPGPRDYQWRADVPSTLVWVVAADGGIPKKGANPDAPVDRLIALPAPFDGEGTSILEANMRIAGRGFGESRGIEWGNDHLAIVTESRFSDRKTQMIAFDPSTPGKPTTIYAGSSQDRYHAPGRPVTEPNASGHPVLKLTADGKGVYFISQGASPQGDMPFVATISVSGGKPTILFRSAAPYYAEPVAVLSDSAVLVRRESQTDSPNYFTASLSGDAAAAPITHFPSPYANIKMPSHQLLKYKRADGLDLTATLWTPYGYDKSQGPLPTLMEAYPAEFKSRAAASQVAGSPFRFPTFSWGGSPVYFTQTGYAVLENAAIPIIGEGKQEPNDTYVQQLLDGAKAAVEYGVSLGVVDPKRVGVMGHSYGAFMTANLLAHTDIFRAGIARSGAYNRTLTPYGFQNEERTYWQDAKVYYDMSPFSYADKIKTPILLIHGEADDNTGTYPIQSERFYAALKGQGATVRLVFLPLEPHHYGAHESLQHMLWEESRWLDTYVKPAVSPAQHAAN
jgi:dipeptidyl aminopeptidase/acylaminoacyl peptidase